MQAAPADEAVTRTAGRGGIAVAFAKVYFILLGLVQQIALPRVLDAQAFGALSRVLSMASIAYNPVITTSIQGVSRAVAQSSPEDQGATARRLFSYHAVFAVLLGGGFFLLAPVLADAVGAPHVVAGLRILSAVMFLYGVYTPLVGVLNGQKRFLVQAALDMTAGTLRTVGLIVGAYWLGKSADLGVEGAAGGFALSAATVFVVALVVVGLGKRGNAGPTLGEHLKFVTPLLAGHILLNLLLQADLQLLGRFASDSALAAGLTAEAADPLVGAYRKTQLFSFLPYQILIAVTFILFPMLASAAHAGDREAVGRYVKTGVRLALILAGLMVSVTAGLPAQMLTLVYDAESAELGARALGILAIGFGAFAIFGILTTVLNSLKRERQSAAMTAVAVTLVAVLCFLRVRGGSLGEELLVRTAEATSIGLAVATLGTAWLVRRTAGAVVAPLTLVRVLGALALTVAVARQLPNAGKLFTIGCSAAVAALYVIVLLATRELGRADLDTIRTVISRRRS